MRQDVMTNYNDFDPSEKILTETLIYQKVNRIRERLAILNEAVYYLGDRIKPILDPDYPETCGDDCSKEVKQHSTLYHDLEAIVNSILEINKVVNRITERVEV